MWTATETFRYPRRFKTMTAVSGVVFAALAVMLLMWLEIGPVRHTEPFAAIMLTVGTSLAWCVTMFRRADDEVVLDESSIAYRVPGRPTLIVSWPEITRVRARDLLQRLELSDVTGTRRIVLAYQMDNFARLRQIIRERTTPPATTGPPQCVFAKSLGAILLPLHWPGVFVLVAAWFWRHGSSPFALVFGIAWGVWVVLSPPWRVRLLDDAVAVEWLGWSRRLQGRIVRALPRARRGFAARSLSSVSGVPASLTLRAIGPGRGARAWSAAPRREAERAARPSASAAARAA
ncbi:MAG TPA: hypothetical protein VGL14_03655 [Methylomirabilota bacterium]